jgi:hypothetical protein
MSRSRVGASSFQLTQESLADILGTLRPSVTLAARTLQAAEAIAYKRGRINIENRANLLDAACECYRILSEQLERWRLA